MKDILTYEKARASLNVLEKRIGKEVDLWKMFSKENIEVPAGRVVITRGANEVVQEQKGLEYIRKCLSRHLFGDFGDLKHYEDWKENILSVWTNQGRILSRFKAPLDIEWAEDIYIITDGLGLEDYHHTTIMLVSEY